MIHRQEFQQIMQECGLDVRLPVRQVAEKIIDDEEGFIRRSNAGRLSFSDKESNEYTVTHEHVMDNRKYICDDVEFNKLHELAGVETVDSGATVAQYCFLLSFC